TPVPAPAKAHSRTRSPPARSTHAATAAAGTAPPRTRARSPQRCAQPASFAQHAARAQEARSKIPRAQILLEDSVRARGVDEAARASVGEHAHVRDALPHGVEEDQIALLEIFVRDGRAGAPLLAAVARQAQARTLQVAAPREPRAVDAAAGLAAPHVR